MKDKSLGEVLREVLTPQLPWDRASDFTKAKFEEAATALLAELMRRADAIQGRIDFRHGPYVYHDDQKTGTHLGYLAGRRVAIVLLDDVAECSVCATAGQPVRKGLDGELYCDRCDTNMAAIR